MAVFRINRSNSNDASFEDVDDTDDDEEDERLLKMCGKARRKRVRFDWASKEVLDNVVEVVAVRRGWVGFVSSVFSSVDDGDDWNRELRLLYVWPNRTLDDTDEQHVFRVLDGD